MDIEVLEVAPGQAPEMKSMPNTQDAFQAAVKGSIESVMLEEPRSSVMKRASCWACLSTGG